MNNYDIVETSIWVDCPFYHCLKKVYLRAIPDNQLYFCGGCDDSTGSKTCSKCISFITSLMENEEIKLTSDYFNDPLPPFNPEPIGSVSNPLHLK